MNLEKLFAAQKVLRDRINYNEPDRFNKLILALLVEIGECANCWRGFKFWSVNQIPHTSAVRVPAMMEEDKEYYNPLLEEYVDGLHFVLELGIEKGFEVHELLPFKAPNVTRMFNYIFNKVGNFEKHQTWGNYNQIFDGYMGLGEMLGFNWKQIEQAYFAKNAINHQRQESGY